MTIGSALALAVERIVEPVEEMHAAVAWRWIGALGTAGRATASSGGAISGLVYRSVRLGAAAVGAGLDAGMTAEVGAAKSIQALVNGLWGDQLGRHEDRLSTSMGVYDQHGLPVRTESEVAAAFPRATGRLVVLVHGLARTERCWGGTGTAPGFGPSLAAHPALTPVAVRYNTGMPIATSGARLAALLEELDAHWPVPIESIALVGHSMGGLVACSAATAGVGATHNWAEKLTDVVTIGSPHRGTPLEKLTATAAWSLNRYSTSRPLARFLDGRSRGIKDLGFATVAGGYASGLASGAAAEHDRTSPIRYHFIGGAVTHDATHPVGAVVGDLVVRPASSTGAVGQGPTHAVVIGGVHHAGLLDEPAVVDRVMGWLAPDDDDPTRVV